MKLEKHRVYCETDSKYEYAWLEEGQSLTTCPVDTSHTLQAGSDSVVEVQEDNSVTLNEKKNNDGLIEFQPAKSYSDSSKSFTTADYSNRQSWWFDTEQVTGEVLTADGGFVNYTTTRAEYKTGWGPSWINWKSIPNNARQARPELKVKVYVDAVEQTSGFSINHATGVVTFDTALTAPNVVTADYHYAKSSLFELVPTAGKRLLVDYVEVQFSVGCDAIPADCYIIFQPIYNGPAVPAYGIPENTDVPLKTFEYHNGADFMNESTKSYVAKAFMDLNKDVNTLPWEYLTGHTMKPPGDASTDISRGEFNKLKCLMVGDGLITNCEIATGTFYCVVEDI